MLAGWLYARAKKNATIVDILWTANLGLIAGLFALLSDAPSARRILIASIAIFWSARLTLHLVMHRLRDHAEDGRYVKLRASWGAAAERNFLFFFQAQAILDVILAVPFFLALRNGAPELSIFEIVGACLLVVATTGEGIADRQLAAFRADPRNRGKTCRRGLWSWSRHPNYFFEWLNWCAFALCAWPAPSGWVGCLSPLLMLVFVLKITGIPPTEAQALKSRGDDYRRYQRETSAFFPWPPKRLAEGTP